VSRILVTGSREWSDWGVIESALRWAYLTCISEPIAYTTVVHGHCPTGADACADLIAPMMGFNVERHPADWKRYGKPAGHIRNAEMVDLGADICIAFPLGESPGTRGCMRLAEKAGIRVEVFTPSPKEYFIE
jgi:hypothetical protein